MSENETEVLCAQLVSKAVLQADERELYELTQLSGVMMDPEIFKILLDLLKLNVPPVAIVQTLRSMCSAHPHYPRDENQPPSLLASGEPQPTGYLHHGGASGRMTDSSSSRLADRHIESSHHGRSESGERGAHRIPSNDRQRVPSSERQRVSSVERQRDIFPPYPTSTSGSSYSGRIGSSKSSTYDANTISSTRYRNLPPERKGATASRGDSYTSRSRSLTSSSQLSSKESDRLGKKRSSYK